VDVFKGGSDRRALSTVRSMMENRRLIRGGDRVKDRTEVRTAPVIDDDDTVFEFKKLLYDPEEAVVRFICGNDYGKIHC
jgi:hypothetical protein